MDANSGAAVARSLLPGAPTPTDNVRPTRERFLLPAEAAKLLGVATSTLRRWADEGKLQSGATIGGHRRYRRSDILRLAEGLGLEEY